MIELNRTWQCLLYCMLYKWSDRARTRDLMTLTQHAAEDGGGLQPDLRSALVLLLTVSVSFSWTGSHLV